MNTLRKLWTPRRLIGLLALLALCWVLRSVPFEDIWATMNRLTLQQVLALAGVNLVILLLFTSRWRLILLSLGYRLPLLSLVGYRLAGFGVSYFTPGPQIGGEPLLVYLTRDRHGLPASAGITAVSLDKLLDLLANFTFITIGLLFVLPGVRSQAAISSPLALLFILLLAIPAAYLLALRLVGRPLAGAARLLSPHLTAPPRLRKAISAMLASEERMVDLLRHKPAVLLQAILISLLIWTCVIFEFRLTLSFLGQPVSWFTTIYLLTAARIAFLLPSPGGLGTLEASQVLAMQALGLSPALALSLSLLIRARDFTLGGLGLWLGAILTQHSPVKALPSQAGD